MKPSYKASMEWVAYNDEPEEANVQTVSESISVMLLAYTFGKTELSVARDIVKFRAEVDLIGEPSIKHWKVG